MAPAVLGLKPRNDSRRARPVHTATTMEFEMLNRLLIVAALAGLAACQTAEGFGEDVVSGGQAIQNASNEVQDDL